MKKIVSLVLAFFMCLALVVPAVQLEADAYAGVPNDVNGNGRVDISDILLLLKKVTDENVEVKAHADFDCDGSITITDVLGMLKFVTNISTQAPVALENLLPVTEEDITAIPIDGLSVPWGTTNYGLYAWQFTGTNDPSVTCGDMAKIFSVVKDENALFRSSKRAIQYDLSEAVGLEQENTGTFIDVYANTENGKKYTMFFAAKLSDAEDVDAIRSFYVACEDNFSTGSTAQNVVFTEKTLSTGWTIFRATFTAAPAPFKWNDNPNNLTATALRINLCMNNGMTGTGKLYIDGLTLVEGEVTEEQIMEHYNANTIPTPEPTPAADAIYNRMQVSEESTKVTFEGGAWPGGVDPANYVIGHYPNNGDNGLTFAFATEQVKFGSRSLVIKNPQGDGNNSIYYRVRLDDAGLESGKDYTLFAWVKGTNLTNAFNQSKITLSARFCEERSGQEVNIGATSLNGVSVVNNSFDWTLLAISFKVPTRAELGKCTSMSFNLDGKNVGNIYFDGVGIIEGAYADEKAYLAEISANIFDASKAEANALGSAKERAASQLRIAYGSNAALEERLALTVAAIKSAENKDEVDKQVALFSSYAATGKDAAVTAVSTATQTAEAVAIGGTGWHELRFDNIVPGSLYAGGLPSQLIYGNEAIEGSAMSVDLIEGVDYEIDYKNGRIRRTASSLIKDAAQNPYYDAADGSYTLGAAQKPELREYTFYVTYDFDNTLCDDYDAIMAEINETNNAVKPTAFINKLNASNNKIEYLVIGDSINTGAEANPGYTFFDRFAAFITEKYGNPVTVKNFAVGGEATPQGLAQLQKAYNNGANPDVITIGFGMNDQNKPGLSVATYIGNYTPMINYIKQKWPNAQIILLTSIPACPVWDATSGLDDDYAAALAAYGAQNSIPVADCNTLSHLEVDAGKHYAEIVTTGVNHPGAYGHRLYFYAIKSLFDMQ